jgi:hypothetical protein
MRDDLGLDDGNEHKIPSIVRKSPFLPSETEGRGHWIDRNVNLGRTKES